MRLVWTQSRRTVLGPTCNGILATETLAQKAVCSGRDNRDFLERLEDWRILPEAKECERREFFSLLSLRLAYRCQNDQLSDQAIYMDQLALYFASIALWMILTRIFTVNWVIALALGTMLLSRGNLLSFLSRVDDWMETSLCIAAFFLASTIFFKKLLRPLPLAFLGVIFLLQNQKLGLVTGSFLLCFVPEIRRTFGLRQAIITGVLAFGQFSVPFLAFFPKNFDQIYDWVHPLTRTDLHWQISIFALALFLVLKRTRKLQTWQARCFRCQITAVLIAFVTLVLQKQGVYFDRLTPDITTPFALEPTILVYGGIAFLGLIVPKRVFPGI